MCPDPECCGGLQYHSTGRDLRSQVQKTLQDEDAYHRDEFEGIMTVLQKLGVTSIKNFKFLQTEDLTAKGMPLVASRILISKFGDKDGNANWKRGYSSRVRKPKSCWEKFMEFLDHALVRRLLDIGFSILEMFACHYSTKWTLSMRNM